jgi:hypothetical protein
MRIENDDGSETITQVDRFLLRSCRHARNSAIARPARRQRNAQKPQNLQNKIFFRSSSLRASAANSRSHNHL